jgi:hypothetical protein
MGRPTKATTAGQAFLALRSKALSAGRTTAEYLRLYALEGFLLRLANSPHKSTFVLKGGVLLAAYELRRPTADVDLAAIATPNAVETIRKLVADVAATPLPDGLDDGLTFDLHDVRAETIRNGDAYGGVRVRLVLASPQRGNRSMSMSTWATRSGRRPPISPSRVYSKPRRYPCAATHGRWC